MKKLREIWPDIDTFFEFPEPEDKKNLPAVTNTKELTTIIERMKMAA